MALATSTWDDVAVTFWHQVYHQSLKAPVPSTCDAVEALLRHELLSHLPDWLSRKAGVLGYTSSHTIVFVFWKEIFRNEDATRLYLVDEALYALPVKMPTIMYQFASWLEQTGTLSIWQGLTVHPQRVTPVAPLDQSSRNPVVKNVKTTDSLRARKVAYPWTGETDFRVAPTTQSRSVVRTSARLWCQLTTWVRWQLRRVERLM